MIDVAKTTETVNRLFDAFDEACSKPGISLLDTFLAAHVSSTGFPCSVRRQAMDSAGGCAMTGLMPPDQRLLTPPAAD